MKKTLLAATCFFIYLLSPQAQTLYGTAFNGGPDGGGAINKFLPATNELTVVKSFESTADQPYYTNFIQASDGKLYGMTSYGGNNIYYGVIFSFDPSSSTYNKLHDFDWVNGGQPYGSLVQATNGKLYGMTHIGGSNNAGVIFSFDPLTSDYTKLKDFGGAQGAEPAGSLIQANNGKLYGMTSRGGSNQVGVIFSFDPSTSVYSKLKDFDNITGASPNGSLVQAGNGKLYGLTINGGSSSSSSGVIFSFDPSSSAYTKLYDFDWVNGGSPFGSLVQARNGKLYGVTTGGGSSSEGVIFSFDPSLLIYTKLQDFSNSNGSRPTGSLVPASNGKLYGLTPNGGSNGVGVIFSFDPSSVAYAKLMDFDNTNGTSPYGSLMEANNGKLYGMTYGIGRGTSYGSVIFSLDPSSSAYAKLKDIGSNENGGNVSASLVHASDGKLYGMTGGGGNNGLGVIFSLDPSSYTYKKLHDFHYPDGGTPYGSLIQASNGKLYGMTNGGGSNGVGVMFSFDPSTFTYTKLHDFDITGGAYPYGSLLQASNGKLYGMTSEGGNNGYGVIFSFDLSSLTFSKLKDCDNTTGAYPYGNLIQASDGKLYAMTTGTIFSLDPSNFKFSRRFRFTYDSYVGVSRTGIAPYGSLVQASDGRLYGMTYAGGNADNDRITDYGVLFSFDPSNSGYDKIKDFGGSTDGHPRGNLMQASDGKLYGMTGISGYSIIFSLDPSGSIFTDLQSFAGNSFIGSAFIEVNDVINNPPVVTITRPSNDATYPAPSDILLTAEATSANAKIKSVEFYNGSTLIFTEYNYPYSRKWMSVPLGDYTITAVATDDEGLQTTSVPIHIHVATDQPPVVNIVSPGDNAIYSAPGIVSLTTVATDPVGKIKSVDFYNGPTLIFTEYNYPYSRKWMDVPAGDYTITAVATDDKGLTTTSAPVHVSVVTPTVGSFTLVDANTDKDLQPLYDGIILDKNTLPQNLNIRANTTPKKVGSVVFMLDGKKVRIENGFPYALAGDSPPGNYHAWTLPLGDHTLTAIPYAKYSGFGQEGVSLTIHFTVVNNQPITLSKKTPAEKDISGETLTVKLSPNPAHNILQVNINGHQNKKSRLFILSASGGIIKTLENLKSNRIEIDVSQLASGTYFVKIISGEKTVYRRFVKL